MEPINLNQSFSYSAPPHAEPSSLRAKTASLAQALLSLLNSLFEAVRFGRPEKQPNPLRAISMKPEPVQFKKAEELFFDPALPPDPIISSPLRLPSAAFLPQKPSLAAMPNGGNTCFLAALTQAVFGGDDKIMQAVDTASFRSQDKNKEALSILSRFLHIYRACQNEEKPVPPSETQRLRKALALLGMEGMGPFSQEDADEAMVAFAGAIAEKCPEGPFTATKLWSLDALGPSSEAPNAALFQEERTLDAKRRIFWEPPQANWGRADLSFSGKTAHFPTMFQTFFFEDKSKEKEPLILKREDDTGRLRPFPLRSKRLCFETAPERLSISFKRFKSGSKIETRVEGIQERIEVPSDYFLDGKGAAYRVDGALFHLGNSPGSGHYTAMRRTIDSKGVHRYFSANDGSVSLVSQKSFLEALPTAYIIFLKKI